MRLGGLRRTSCLIALWLFAAAVPPASGSPCAAPPTRPTLALDDVLGNEEGAPGHLLGNGLCELFCGIATMGGEGLPLCAAADCLFQLRLPSGITLRKLLAIGPRTDGSPQMRGTAGLCTLWREWYPQGEYRASLDCVGSEETARIEFAVEASHAGELAVSGNDGPPCR